MSTIPCDFCPHPVDRGQMEEIEISHYVPDSSGDDLAYARTYFFGHPDCVRKFYRACRPQTRSLQAPAVLRTGAGDAPNVRP